MQPTEKLEFLGMVIDSVRMSLSLPSGKIESISKWCQKLLKMEETTIREFEFSELESIGNSLRSVLHKYLQRVQIEGLCAAKRFSNKFCLIFYAKRN